MDFYAGQEVLVKAKVDSLCLFDSDMRVRFSNDETAYVPPSDVSAVVRTPETAEQGDLWVVEHEVYVRTSNDGTYPNAPLWQNLMRDAHLWAHEDMMNGEFVGRLPQ